MTFTEEAIRDAVRLSAMLRDASGPVYRAFLSGPHDHVEGVHQAWVLSTLASTRRWAVRARAVTVDRGSHAELTVEVEGACG